MCILQPRALLLAWGAAAASALAPQLAAAQSMARPISPGAGSMSRPLMTNPNPAVMGSSNGFRSPSSGTMASPGVSAASPYGAGSTRSPYGTGGYGGGSYGGGTTDPSYGAQGGTYGAGSQGYGGNSGTASETAAEGKNLSRVLTAAGVSNDAGRLQWPVALRVVGGAEGDELRRQIDGLLQYGAGETQAGPVSPHLTQELARAVAALRELLRHDREERFSLALTSYEESERFLGKLDRARKLFEAARGSAEGKGGTEGTGG